MESSLGARKCLVCFRILPDQIKSFRFNSSDGFEKQHEIKTESNKNIIFETDDFVLHAILMNHKIPSTGYVIREKDLVNIDKESLERENLPGGPWIEEIKNPNISPDKEIEIENKRFTAGYLRDKLLKKTKGGSIAYLTDFLFEHTSSKNLQNMIQRMRYFSLRRPVFRRRQRFSRKEFSSYCISSSGNRQSCRSGKINFNSYFRKVYSGK